MSLKINESNVTEQNEPQIQLLAVIDIGATSVRMLIAEVRDEGRARTLETLAQAVNLGKDSFITGHITRQTIEDCVHVLKIYRAKLREYGIDRPEQVRVVATSAVREADNRIAFLDRVYIATGFQIEPFDEAELHRVTFLGIQSYLEDNPQLMTGQTLVCEVGGGSTELLVLIDGQVAFARTYRLGALRLRKTLEVFHSRVGESRGLMESQIDQTIQQFQTAVDRQQSRRLIVMGSDMRLAATQIGGQEPNGTLVAVSVDRLEALAGEVLHLRPDALVSRYRLSIPEAESLGPALLVNLRIAKALGVDSVLVATANLRDGLIKEMTTGRKWTGEAENQIINSALQLGRKFSFDEKHAIHMSHLAVDLFEQLSETHQLGPRWEAILRLAALLHEVGMSINIRSYHKHTMYIIRNSVFFGVSSKDLDLVALVARYQRRAIPQPTHEGYCDLSREDRAAVSKLAALLRIAKALDASRCQRVDEIRCHVLGSTLVVGVANVSDLSLEQLDMRDAQVLFEHVFGLKVELRSENR